MECEYEKRKKCDSLYIERYNKLLKEIERLNNIIKTKDEGIKALTEDLCDTAEENERLNKENEELNEIINIRECQLEEMQKQKTDYTQVNILEMKLEGVHSIIKEVREWVYKIQQDNKRLEPIISTDELDGILEILDKGV